MKRYFYAISLLFSFLIVLGHDLIPHQHDLLESGVKGFNVDIQSDVPHSDDHHHDHDADDSNDGKPQKSDHNRNPFFPYHNHFYSDTDFDFTRLNSNNSVNVSQSTQTVAFHSTSSNVFTRPIGYIAFNYRKKPFLIRSLYQPAANALRGPPAIA